MNPWHARARSLDEPEADETLTDQFGAFAPLAVLAEDDTEMRSLLALTLRGAGFIVLECGDGATLLALLAGLSDASELDRVDVIVTDVRMPGISGLEALRRSATIPDLPRVIVITAFGDEATVRDAFDYGADAVFDKPFDPGLLILRAKELVHEHRKNRPK